MTVEEMCALRADLSESSVHAPPKPLINWLNGGAGAEATRVTATTSWLALRTRNSNTPLLRLRGRDDLVTFKVHLENWWKMTSETCLYSGQIAGQMLEFSLNDNGLQVYIKTAAGTATVGAAVLVDLQHWLAFATNTPDRAQYKNNEHQDITLSSPRTAALRIGSRLQDGRVFLTDLTAAEARQLQKLFLIYLAANEFQRGDNSPGKPPRFTVDSGRASLEAYSPHCATLFLPNNHERVAHNLHLSTLGNLALRIDRLLAARESRHGL